MNIRKSAVAGQFYPALNSDCIKELQQCLEDIPAETLLPKNIAAAIVPHAGWVFSGPTAAAAFTAIRSSYEKVHTFIILGAVHHFTNSIAAVYNKGLWTTPIGETKIDEDLAQAIIKKCPLVKPDIEAHTYEHSIEVQLPFIQHLFPGAKILPILITPTHDAITIGQQIADVIKQTPEKNILVIASTDLTHYGPRYGFDPMGIGPDAIEWAKSVNDQKFIDAALQMLPEKMILTALEDHSACGPGAAAAAVAAAKYLGRSKGTLLAHTTSDEIMKQKFNQTSTESVGYASIVF